MLCLKTLPDKQNRQFIASRSVLQEILNGVSQTEINEYNSNHYEKIKSKSKGIISDAFFFNWRITALQYCVGFCHTT